MISRRNSIILSTLLLFLGFAHSGSSQIKLLKAKIISTKDSSRLAGVHVVNNNTAHATHSYTDGTFILPYRQGDTIELSSIGFKDKLIFTQNLFIPDAIEITVFMEPEVYVLNPVNVNPFGSKEEFADEFKTKDIESKEVEIFEYKDQPKTLEDVPTDLNAHISLGSPITFLYNKFSKEAKEKKKLAKAKDTNAREREIQRKYNIDVVKKVTGIESDADAAAFMKKCPLDDDYVYRAAEYDIVKSILECQKQNQPVEQ